jgi:hypothetical protein
MKTFHDKIFLFVPSWRSFGVRCKIKKIQTFFVEMNKYFIDKIVVVVVVDGTSVLVVDLVQVDVVD